MLTSLLFAALMTGYSFLMTNKGRSTLGSVRKALNPGFATLWTKGLVTPIAHASDRMPLAVRVLKHGYDGGDGHAYWMVQLPNGVRALAPEVELDPVPAAA